jgi:RNA polymerase sigma-70 factor, ECF subfamily
MTFEERELVSRLRAGDRQGFDALYRIYVPRVMGFACRLTGCRADAEDLVQEVFVAAYAAAPGFEGRSGLLSWLLAIAVRRWRDRSRRRSVETVPPLDDDGTEEGAPSPGPGSALEEQVVRSLTLTHALAALEPPFREALLLVASQGLTYREAAEVLGEPVGTVKWRVSEASRRLRALLGAVEEECHEVQVRQPRADCVSCRR